MNRIIQIAPSILAADILQLGKEVTAAEKAGANWIHIDIMDGHFVPNLSLGPSVIKNIKKITNLPLDVHLMLDPVDNWIEIFAEAGADHITIHIEASNNIKATFNKIHSLGLKAGISLKPETKASSIIDAIEFCDLVLVMTVNPGFGGQKFLEPQLKKIQYIRNQIDKINANIDLVVDGGITSETAALAIKAGANVLVAGSSFFKGGISSYTANLASLITEKT